MTIDDRNYFFSLMVFYDNFDNWLKDTESELNEKDKKKLSAINKMVLDLINQYAKKQGIEAFNSMLDETKNYKVAVVQKDEALERNLFDFDVLRHSIKNVISNDTECSLCEKAKHIEQCDRYILNQFMGTEPCNKCKGECPYKYKIDLDFKI